MDTAAHADHNTTKARRVNPIANTSTTGHAFPTTFFLRSETDMEKSISRDVASSFVEDDESVAASIAETSYGVQSLEDTMSLSNDSAALSTRSGVDDLNLLSRKRKPGNPVHPKIYATGQRIVSSEHPHSPSSLPFADSPSRSHVRRASIASSAHLTPLNLSPQPEADYAGTPRSSSIKSLKLSDEEQSVASENSQAIQSSSSEEDLPSRDVRAETRREHQLVMPSISVPTRRPFTQRGRDIGQFKIMVVGGNGLGKSSLIRSMFRVCEDIVHIDGMSNTSTDSMTTAGSGLSQTTQITEIQASTRPYPVWWSDAENARSWWRRKSFGSDVLERNVCFVDTPGIDNPSMAEHILKQFDLWYLQAAALDRMSDNQLLNLFSGKSDGHVDIVLYMLEADKVLSASESSFIRNLSKRTNLLPIIAKCDAIDQKTLDARREELALMLKSANIDFVDLPSAEPRLHAVSSLIADGDVMDASTLMASSYLPALAPSDLDELVHTLFDPNTIARLRHESLLKFLTWRRTHISQITKINATISKNAVIPHSFTSPAITSTGSIVDDPSKILVQHPFPSYYRSLSPTASESSDPNFRPSLYQLPPHEDEISTAGPSRNVHIAKWAQDLRQSLTREGKLTRPSKGRLGGELAVMDPRDPLGILSLSQRFGRRGWFALQILGGCGLVGAAMYWFARNWFEWQDWAWSGQASYLAPIALPAPTKSWIDNFRLV